ncbi:hypothetical protein [Dyadobacter sp. CY347]|uniref:hypothetical protein n=1 Tax=Dyadobacter sp. CY347 TaxID=2909336 RepID=UPI001F1A5452|nr:hypothetical protein [Dyadobacter sp. CY347]MCF2489871.1 hypothetical protein [Dyadobacter sp. CY347]
MRTLILQIAFLSCTIIPCIAQDKGKSELAMSFGIMPTEDILSEFFMTALLTMAGRLPEKNFDDRAFALTYKYHLTERFALGASVAYNAAAHETRFLNWSDYDPRPKTVSFAVESNFFYLKRPKVNLYASMAGGFFASSKKAYDGISDETQILPTLHYSPIGVRVGKGVAGFVELGYGFKGMVNGGLSIRF